MSFSPTPEQQAIIQAAKETTDNLLISALAGAAKTSTLVLIAEALPKTSILCLAFNKRIATEMQERLPSTCTSSTLNSLGHRAWGQFLGKRLVVDTKKNYSILSTLVEDLPKREKERVYDIGFADILKMIEYAKVVGYVPDGHFPHSRPLMRDDDFFASWEQLPTELEERLVRDATIVSLTQGMQGKIDFSDQILLPTIFPASFDQYPLVMVDEAQDLSELNHVMLQKIAKRRLIAVGDECQSIYGFRGAHPDSMSQLRATFSMRPLTLSVSFRCPVEVVKAAQWRAPHMQWGPTAKPGLVQDLRDWDTRNIPQVATIICRNNAPLFSIAIRLLRNGRYPQLVGNDLGKSLVKVMKKFGPPTLPREEVYLAIDRWEQEKLAKARSAGRVSDQAECFRVFAEQGEDLSEAIAYAEHLLTSSGPVQLMTIHKSKGLEFPSVYLLDKHLIRTSDNTQEQNLLYVAITRAKEELYYITSEGFQAND
jgi:DNA helicase-2/ATP-dependent DNA helicase PcrA